MSTICDGLADAFCPSCMGAWVQDEKLAHFEALASAIETGEVTARFGTYTVDFDQPGLGRVLKLNRPDPLAPDEARGLARMPSRPGWPNFWARLIDVSVILFVGDTPLDDVPSNANSWPDTHWDRVRMQLRAKGWRAPSDNPYREITVCVASDGAIRVGSASP
jgi:hypothetical protein